MIGGLAILCFTKAFSIVFLGNARKNIPHEIKEPPFIELLPLYFIALFIVLIGLFPLQFIKFLSHTVLLFTANIYPTVNSLDLNTFQVLQPISFAMWGLVLLIICLFLMRKFILNYRKDSIQPSWGCAYNAPTIKLQYTANSFVRPYRKLFRPFLLIFKFQKDTDGIFPGNVNYNTHPYDKIEKYLIDNPIKAFKSFLSRFLFLQNGKLQFYILYGIIFIVSIICIPLFYEQIITFIEFLKQL
jgi:hypothetical protein